MPLLTWQLWLARESVIDNPLPWQKSIVSKLTPGRVAKVFGRSFGGYWYTRPISAHPVERPRGGLKGKPESVEFAIQLSKKVLPSRNNNNQSRLDPLTFLFRRV